MPNLIVKSLVLTTVVAGCGVVFWQAQQGLQTANQKNAADQFSPLAAPANPAADDLARNAPETPAVKPQDELQLPNSFPDILLADSQKPPQPTLAKPQDPPAPAPVLEQKIELFQPRPDPQAAVAARARDGESNGGFNQYFSASGKENELAQTNPLSPEAPPALAQGYAPAGPVDPFAALMREESAASPNPRLAGPAVKPAEEIVPAGIPGPVNQIAEHDPFANPPPARVAAPEPAALPLLSQAEPVLPAAVPLTPPATGNVKPESPARVGIPWNLGPAGREHLPVDSAPAVFPGLGDNSPQPRPQTAHAEAAPEPTPLLPRLSPPPVQRPEMEAGGDPFAQLAGGVNEPAGDPSRLPGPRDVRPLDPAPAHAGADPFALPPAAHSPEPTEPLPLPPVDASAHPRPVPVTEDVFPTLGQFPESPAPRQPVENAAPAVPEMSPVPTIRPGHARSASNNNPVLNPQPIPALSPPNANESLPRIQPLGTENLPRIQPLPAASLGAELPIPTGPQSPELKIEKIAPPQAVVGEAVIYSIVVRNVGGSTARDVVVEDRVPRGSDLEGTIPQAYMKEAGRLNWTIGTLAPGEQREIKLKVIPRQAGQIGSVATVSFAAAVRADIRVTAPDLKVSIQGPPEAVLGEKVTYKLVLQNQGEGRARDVWLRARLPEGLKHPEGSDVELQVGLLEPGASHSVSLVVAADKLGVLSPQATVSNDGKACGEAQSELRIIRNRLEITRVGPEGSFVGRPGNWSTRVKNESQEALRDLTITERVPAEVELQQMSQGGQWDPRSRLLTWRIPAMQPGETLDFQTVTVSSIAGSYEGLVAAQDGGGSGVNRAEVKTSHNVLGYADLAVDINSQQRQVTIGDQVSLRLTLKNDGTASARNVTTRFLIPAGLQFENAQGPVKFRQEGRTVVFDPLVEVPVRGEQSFDVILSAAAVGQATVTMELQSADDPEPLRRDQKIRVLGR